MESLLDYNFAGLTALLAAEGLPSIHAKALWRALHRFPGTDLTHCADFLPPLQRWLATNLGSRFHADLPQIVTDIPSTDGLTHKLLLELKDGARIETVVMGYTGRYTACISTQVGCAMGCVFCATGQGGFTRHLTVGEIVSQVLRANLHLADRGLPPLRNLVLMGMGEPLHNYEAVMTALNSISERSGINIGPSKISISTVGVIPGIKRLADEQRPYNLALSLHAATNEGRSALIPVNKRWPLSELIEACHYYADKTGRRIFVEWTLIHGENDTPEIANQLAGLLRGLDAHINLIPLNPTSGYDQGPSRQEAINTFHRMLQEAGFPTTVRQRRGIDVAAGCGQLAGAA